MSEVTVDPLLDAYLLDFMRRRVRMIANNVSTGGGEHKISIMLGDRDPVTHTFTLWNSMELIVYLPQPAHPNVRAQTNYG